MGKVSEPGANSSSLSNGMVEKAYLRGNAKESALKHEEEKLKLSNNRVTRSMRRMTTANDKSLPSTPSQQVTLYLMCTECHQWLTISFL